MKTVVSLLLSLILLSPGIAWAEPALKDGDISLKAPSALLMEKMTGQVLYEKNADEAMLPASVTKVMTMLLIVEDIESGKVSLDDTVTASERAASFGGSCVYLEAGEKMSVSDMLKCISVVSANDCAVAMAEHLSGTEQLFVDRMNERARELGLKNTHVTNCTGLFEDKDHYTSARDVAIMSRELIKHGLIKKYSTIWMDSIRDGEFELSNTNKLVSWYEGCTGLKTGYTSAAKYCLAATAERDGVEYIAVIMGGESSDSRNAEAATLLNYAFANYRLCPLRDGSPLPELPVDLGARDKVSLSLGGEEYALIPKSGGMPEYKLELPDRVKAPVKAGEKLGRLVVSIGAETVAELPVLAGEEVERMGFFGALSRLGRSLLGL